MPLIHLAGQRSAGPREAVAGLRAMLPVAIAAVPIGLLFGALCAGKGLSVTESGLMSILVFAGGAQFAAVELWTWPVSLATLAISTLLINARLGLMSASLLPKLRHLSRRQRLLACALITDETWALAEQRALAQPISPAYWYAQGLLLLTVWSGTTMLGASLGALLGAPERIGADFVFTALFIGLIAGFWRGPATGWTIAASGAVAALVHLTLGSPWHIMAGAAAGMLAGYLAALRPAALA